MLVNRQTINCAFAFSCKKFALFELTDPMRRKIFVQMFLQGEARLIALQVPKERLSGNLTSIGRICSNPLCLAGQYFLTGLWLNPLLFFLCIQCGIIKKLLFARNAELTVNISVMVFKRCLLNCRNFHYLGSGFSIHIHVKYSFFRWCELL